MAAARCRSGDTVDVLLHASADPNIVEDARLYTALRFAIESRDMVIIDKLCAVTTTNVGISETLGVIARERLTMSGPLVKYVSDKIVKQGIF